MDEDNYCYKERKANKDVYNKNVEESSDDDEEQEKGTDKNKEAKVCEKNYEQVKEIEIEISSEQQENESIQNEENSQQQQSFRRSNRNKKQTDYLKDYIFGDESSDMSNIAYCLISDSDPLTYREAINKKKKKWEKAIEAEIKSLENMKTWTEAALPKNEKAIETKWVFRTKQDESKKARLVAKGFQINNAYNVYSPVARMSTIRMMFSFAIQENLQMKQFDVPTAFLNGELNEDVYIKPPEGVKVEKGKVLKLKKALYGLRQAPKCCAHTMTVLWYLSWGRFKNVSAPAKFLDGIFYEE